MTLNDLLNSINYYKFPYDAGLWIKSLNLTQLNLNLLNTEQIKLVESILNKNANNQDIINQFIKIIVNYQLLPHISEEISIDNIFKKSFFKVDKETALNIYNDLEELTLEEFSENYGYDDGSEFPDLTNYKTIKSIIFNNPDIDNNFQFYSNWAAFENQTTSKKMYYYTNTLAYPCTIALSNQYFIIFWSNL